MKFWKIVFCVLGLVVLRESGAAQVHAQWIASTDSLSASAITVDRSGNVYVAGGMFRGTSGYNITLVKYDTAGVPQWMSEFNGIGDDADVATAIALDTSGNIFVTGYSFRGPAALNFEMVTIKFTPAGDSLWVRRFNGTGAQDDRAFALAVDTAGNAYVGGYLNNISLGNVYGQDYITIKYAPDGTQQWAAQLDLFEACVNALAVDPAGNVYITGAGTDGTPANTGITAKYGPGGGLLWSKGTPAQIATGLVLDDSDNVYVTGYGQGVTGFYDFVTMKYDSAGTEQWTSRYTGPVDEDDKARGIVVDKNHNVYVTGEASVMPGSYVRDYATVKYGIDGDSLWAKLYDGAGSIDKPVDIAIDSAGSVYVTGSSVGSFLEGSSNDYATIKYGANGDSLWARRYNPANLEDQAVAVEVDLRGNVYVTGVIQTSFTSGGSGTIKYSQAVVPAAWSTEVPAGGAGSTTLFGGTGLTFIGDVTVPDSVTVFYYLESPDPGEFPSGIVGIGDYFWRVFNDGTIFTNGYMRLSTEDLVGVTVGGCGACLVWLKRDNAGDAWENIGGSLDGTLDSGTLTSTTPFGSFSEFAIGSTDSTTLDVEEGTGPYAFELAQNYPNPFNPVTSLQYALPENAHVRLNVFNVLGEVVATLVDGEQEAGRRVVQWDAAHLPSGVYFSRLTAGPLMQTGKMVLMR